MVNKKHIVWFNEVDKDDVDLVGGKGANLGEMVGFGLPVPNGFIVTSYAYFYFLKENRLELEIKRILKTSDISDPKQLHQASDSIKNLILKGSVPKDLARQIISFYEELSGRFKHCLVAVRSSATAEDLPDASFAGQQETYLNVKGEANLVNKVRQCWASLFTPRAIFYRQEKKFDHFKVGIAVPVQKMVQSNTSGVMFTLDPVTNNKKVIIIEAVYGLGELIVQGAVTPDHYEVRKSDFKIVKKQINRQEIQLIKVGSLNKQIRVKTRLQNKQKIKDNQINDLARLGKKIHQHYFFPQDIEWAIEKNKTYILQARPVTTLDRKTENRKQKTEEQKKINLPLIVKGNPASPGLVSGYARIIDSARQIDKVKLGEILVTKMTTPDFVPAMKRAAAIVTDEGGQTSHAAIVSRELGISCVVGTKNGTKEIKTGMVITVNGKTGEVFKGGLKKGSNITLKQIPFEPPATGYKPVLKTATKVYVNLGEPDLAQKIAKSNVDGVGLLRAEFMISEAIGIHPKKLIKEKKEKIFIEKLTDGLKTFCSAFNPRPVVYRTTDFKTNEYKNLKGGKDYEPEEANPMLGFRGAFRYVNNEEVFELELKAIKNIRNKLGFKNLWLMIPFVRTVQELIQVKKIVASSGLSRSPSFQLWMMVEIPSNVILLEDFIKVGIDGVSVGTNDLTMLLLGVDRDNDKVAELFDERNQAVLWALEKIIKTCKKSKITSSICGQAPTSHPDLVEKLVEWGMTSISVSPDAIEKTRQLIYEVEKRKLK